MSDVAVPEEETTEEEAGFDRNESEEARRRRTEDVAPEPRAVYPELDGEGGTVFRIGDDETTYATAEEAQEAANSEAGVETDDEDVAVEDEE